MERHAREKIRSDYARDKKRGDLPIIGIASHTARYPHTCEDCGSTFWDTDEYGLKHPRCKRFSAGITGF